jgi:hypothetical protein
MQSGNKNHTPARICRHRAKPAAMPATVAPGKKVGANIEPACILGNLID